MAKEYYLNFGATNTGLTPTFTVFAMGGVTAVAAPGITETTLAPGVYQFQYTPTFSILFEAVGASVLITGGLDPVQAVDLQIGQPSDSFGSTAVDPATLMGYMKRNQEVQEGDAVFNKSSAVWSVSSRGASTLLFEKDLTNSTTQATKA